VEIKFLKTYFSEPSLAVNLFITTLYAYNTEKKAEMPSFLNSKK